MSVVLSFRPARLALFVPLAGLLASCASLPGGRRLSEEECMTRVMYFESNRSSEDGMLAVGTVVMNRKASGKYPSTVCGVVGQNNQFAPGVLSKPMGKGRVLAAKMARQVLRGAKNERVGRAMFFHTAGYSYPYTNMHYVAIAGGNAFYEKRRNATSTQADVARRESRLVYSPEQREPVLEGRPKTFDPVWTAPATEPQSTPNWTPEWIPVEPQASLERQPVYGAPHPAYRERASRDAQPVYREPTARRIAPSRLPEMSIEEIIIDGY